MILCAQDREAWRELAVMAAAATVQQGVMAARIRCVQPATLADVPDSLVDACFAGDTSV